jgi:CBS domain-containing protein
MSESSTQKPSSPPAEGTVAHVMRPALTTAERNDHVAAAAYLMKHYGATALVVLEADTRRVAGIITETDVTNVVANGKNANDVRIFEVMAADPAVVDATTGIRQAAELMTTWHVRHLPVIDDDGALAGIVDLDAVCRALLDLPALGQ